MYEVGNGYHADAYHGDRKVSYDDAAHLAQEQGVKTGEAAENFGDYDTLEQYGYVQRGSALPSPTDFSD